AYFTNYLSVNMTRIEQRRATSCPERLTGIIELVNSVPPSVELPHPIEVFGASTQELPAHLHAQNLASRLLSLPESLREVLDALYHRCQPRHDQRKWLEDFGKFISRTNPTLSEIDVHIQLISTVLVRIDLVVQNNQFTAEYFGKYFLKVHHHEPLLDLLHD